MRPPLQNIRHHGDFRIALAYEDGLVAELDFREHLESRSGPMIEPPCKIRTTFRKRPSIMGC